MPTRSTSKSIPTRASTGTGETVLKRRIADRRRQPAGDRRVPRRQGRPGDRGPLREALPRHVLAWRPAARRRPERGRHRAVGPQGPVLQRADLPDAGRPDARRDPRPTPTSPTGASPDEFVANLRALVDRGYRAAKTGLPLFYGEKAEPAVRRTGYFGTPGPLGPVAQGDGVPADARFRRRWRAGSRRRARRSAGSSS